MLHFHCPEKDSSRDSYAITHKENKGQKVEAATGADSCKRDSAASARCEC
jgi:hypothetical protein